MTLMSLIIVIITCVSMKIAICSSGTAQITELGDYVLDFTAGYSEEKVSDTSEYIRQFEEQFTEELAMVRSHFCMYNWLITGTVIIISGLVVFFVSRRSLEPLKRFSGQLGEIRMENIADMRIKEDNVAEFALLSRSLNDMLDRISHAFEAQHQFTANAAHELRTPLSLMQSQMDLYVEENQDVSEKTDRNYSDDKRTDGAAVRHGQDTAGYERAADGSLQRYDKSRTYDRGSDC